MTPKKIAELAQQADLWMPHGLPSNWDSGDYVVSPEQLRLFAELVRDATLREVAEFCRAHGMSSITVEAMQRSLKS